MAYSTILLKGSPRKEELEASATVTPGFLCEVDSNNKVKPHATAGGPAEALFAYEDELQGNEISDDYSSGNQVTLISCKKGDKVVARISNGENIAIGDTLVSNGDGYLKEATPDSSGVVTEEVVVAIADDACDMSDSSSVDPANTCAVVIV